jgi:hypothetical protein
VDDEPYPRLLGQKGGTGFPTVMFMDETGTPLARPSARSVKAFNETFEVLDGWRTLKTKFESGDQSVAGDLLVAELNLGQIDFPEAALRRQALQGLSRREARDLDELLAASESGHILKTSRELQEAGPKLLEMKEAERIPTGKAGEQFFRTILQYASAMGDAKLFQKNLVDMKRRYTRDRTLRDYFKSQDIELARLRRG